MKTLKFFLFSGLTMAIGCSPTHKADDVINDQMVADCSAGQVNDIGAGIVNGQTVKSGSWVEKSTVFLLILKKEACTASIVSDHILLTAAHCVDEAATSGQTGTDLGVAVFSANWACDENRGKVNFAEVRVNPDYALGKTSVKGDVALMRLVDPVPYGYVPAKIASKKNFEKLDDNSTVFMGVGYGKTSGYKTDDKYLPRLRVTQLKPKSQLELGDNIYFDQKDTGICAGDSGGPLYAKIKDQEYLVGVNSVVSNPFGDEACSGESRMMNIDKNRDFLAKAFAELDPDAQNPFKDDKDDDNKDDGKDKDPGKGKPRGHK